jgi:hypothetical protein
MMMPRPPKTAISQDIRQKVGRLDSLSDEEIHYLRSRLRSIVDQHFEDLDWFFGELSMELDRKRRGYTYTFEVAILHDPKAIFRAIKKMEGWKANLESSIDALGELHSAAFRRL